MSLCIHIAQLSSPVGVLLRDLRLDVAPGTIHTLMGPSGAGQLTKSCNQMIVGCNLVVIAEMLAIVLAAAVARKWPLSILPTQMSLTLLKQNVKTVDSVNLIFHA